MASTASDLRIALLALREDATGRLSHIWTTLDAVLADAVKGDPKAQADVTNTLSALLPGVVGDYQSMAAALAAESYSLDRQLHEVPGAFSPKVLIPPQGIPSLIGWSFSEATTVDGFVSFIGGGVQKRIAQAANGTIMASNLADPKGRGWERVASADACPFCRMLATRGAVYRSLATASFAPHNDCHCVAVAAWDGTKVRIGDVNGENGQARYTPTSRNLSATQRRQMHAQANQWAADHGLIEGRIEPLAA